jgi:hypothetical protein
MTAVGLALRLAITTAEARELLVRHHDTYRVFWRWSDAVVSLAFLNNHLASVFGWPLHVTSGTNPRTLRNFPEQANGAEMMRLAAIGATEAGLEVCCPVHDAFLLCAPIGRLNEDVARMREIMRRASVAVTGGLEVRTDVKLVRAGERYVDERGTAMWSRINSLLDERKAA